MRFFRIFPLVCASTMWSLSSFTRNIAFGSSSTTWPLNSIMSSFDMRFLLGGAVRRSPPGGEGRPDKRNIRIRAGT